NRPSEAPSLPLPQNDESPTGAGPSDDGRGWFRTSDLSRVKSGKPAAIRSRPSRFACKSALLATPGVSPSRGALTRRAATPAATLGSEVGHRGRRRSSLRLATRQWNNARPTEPVELLRDDLTGEARQRVQVGRRRFFDGLSLVTTRLRLTQNGMTV